MPFQPSQGSLFHISKPSRRQFLHVVGGSLALSCIGRSADPPYSLIVFPDEQYLATGALYSQLTQWVVDNRHTTAIDGTDLNIIGVVSVGDCADAPSITEDTGQCAVVKAAYKLLDNAGVPFIAPPGNHDYTALLQRTLGPNFRAGGYMSPSVRAAHPGYGGSYDEDMGIARSMATGANWWMTLAAGSRRILLIALECFPRDAVVSWARAIQDARPDHECIITTHAYVTDTGVLGDRTIDAGPQSYYFADRSPDAPTDTGRGLSGEQMWGSRGVSIASNSLKNWQSLTAIFSGHYVYSASRANSKHYHRVPIQSSSPRGQMVHQFYCNAQDLDVAGDANSADLCILRFQPANGTVSTYWMSRKSLKWSDDSVRFFGPVQPLESGIPYAGIAGSPPITGAIPSISAVVNGASFAPGIAQGSWIAVQGRNLSTMPARTWRDTDFVNGLLPKQLDGVSVNVNGKPAAVYYISPTQINVLSPADPAEGQVAVEVAVNGVRSALFFVNLQRFAPGLFLWRNREVVATHLDFTPATSVNTIAGAVPAHPGEIAIFYGTGFGQTVPPPPPERPAAGGEWVTDPVLVHFEGATNVAVNALGVALTPGVASVYQIAVKIPDGTPPGDLSVWVEIGGVRSQAAILNVGPAL